MRVTSGRIFCDLNTAQAQSRRTNSVRYLRVRRSPQERAATTENGQAVGTSTHDSVLLDSHGNMVYPIPSR